MQLLLTRPPPSQSPLRDTWLSSVLKHGMITPSPARGTPLFLVKTLVQNGYTKSSPKQQDLKKLCTMLIHIAAKSRLNIYGKASF